MLLGKVGDEGVPVGLNLSTICSMPEREGESVSNMERARGALICLCLLTSKTQQ